MGLQISHQEGCDSAAGPEAELSDTGYAGGDSPGGAEGLTGTQPRSLVPLRSVCGGAELLYVRVCAQLLSQVRLFVTLRTATCQAPLWEISGKSTSGFHFLLQGIFLTQEFNLCLLHLLHCRQILYLLSHQGSP